MKRNVMIAEGTLMFVKVELPKGFKGELDQHVEEQISYIEVGKVEFTVAGEMRLLVAGDALYIPSDVPHFVNVLEDCTILDVFTPIRSSHLEK